MANETTGSISRRAFLKTTLAGAAAITTATVLGACSGTTSAPPATAPPATGPAATGPVATAPVATAPVATKVAFPAAGKTVTLNVPWAAGGPADLSARFIAPGMEKALGCPVQIVNKGGAATQIGNTEVALAIPDGYTLGQASLPTVCTVYLNPDRQAVFGRNSFEMVGLYVNDPGCFAVRADSPYKDLKDLVEAAKAKPGEITVAATGVLAMGHLQTLLFEKASGTKFNTVQAEGGAQALTFLLGGHVDVSSGVLPDVAKQHNTGEVRILGLFSEKESVMVPGVKTAESQGYKIYWGSSRGWVVPKGTPKEIIDILSSAVKKGMESEGVADRVKEMGVTMQYMTPSEYAKYWGEVEAMTIPILEQEGVKVKK